MKERPQDLTHRADADDAALGAAAAPRRASVSLA